MNNDIQVFNDFLEKCKNNDKEEMKNIYYANKLYRENNKFGYVYFLYNESTGLTKIGRTMDIKKRMRNIISNFKNNIGIEPEFELRALLYSHETVLSELEFDLHSELHECRKFGEWFDLRGISMDSYIPLESMIVVKNTLVSIDDAHDFHLYEDIEFSDTDNHKLLFDLICNICENKDVGFRSEVYDIENNIIKNLIIHNGSKINYNTKEVKINSFDELKLLDSLSKIKNLI